MNKLSRHFGSIIHIKGSFKTSLEYYICRIDFFKENIFNYPISKWVYTGKICHSKRKLKLENDFLSCYLHLHANIT